MKHSAHENRAEETPYIYRSKVYNYCASMLGIIYMHVVNVSSC